jgi:UDP-glucose 4-epimerase
MSKTAIVYGGSGFLGSHVADALSDAGYAVTIFDKLPSPYLRAGQKMVVGDISDLEAVKKSAEGHSYVYNFAGIADIGESRKQPLNTASVNIMGNLNTLEAARLCKARRFIFASTVYVFSEEGSFYRASKQAGERFVEAYKDQFELDYTILRYGSLYGRRATEKNGIHRLLKQAIEKKVIAYEGNSDSMREYIHVEDAARLSVKILEEEYANRHIIITGHERLAVKSLLKMISEMIPGQVETKFVDSPSDGHYVMSPYSFSPKIGHKLISNDHIDIGQGLLDCLADIHESLHEKSEKR